MDVVFAKPLFKDSLEEIIVVEDENAPYFYVCRRNVNTMQLAGLNENSQAQHCLGGARYVGDRYGTKRKAVGRAKRFIKAN